MKESALFLVDASVSGWQTLVEGIRTGAEEDGMQFMAAEVNGGIPLTADGIVIDATDGQDNVSGGPQADLIVATQDADGNGTADDPQLEVGDVLDGGGGTDRLRVVDIDPGTHDLPYLADGTPAKNIEILDLSTLDEGVGQTLIVDADSYSNDLEQVWITDGDDTADTLIVNNLDDGARTVVKSDLQSLELGPLHGTGDQLMVELAGGVSVADVEATSSGLGTLTLVPQGSSGNTVAGFTGLQSGATLAIGGAAALTLDDLSGLDDVTVDGSQASGPLDIDGSAIADTTGDGTQITGGAGPDTLVGSSNGANELAGDGGSDTLISTGQVDTLTGGNGNDRFQGATADLDNDTITDLAHGDGVRITGVTGLGADNVRIHGGNLEIDTDATDFATPEITLALSGNPDLRFSVADSGSDTLITFINPDLLLPPDDLETDTIDGRTIIETAEDGVLTRTIRPGGDAGDDDDVAMVPVARDGDSETRLTTQLPDGIGLTARGSADPVDSARTLRNLLRDNAEDVKGERAGIDSAIDNYVDRVGEAAPTAIERQIGFSTSGGAEPDEITLSGSADGQEALTVDVSNPPSGTTINLDHVDFAVFTGDATVTGGAGENFAIGDGSDQVIVLGAGDDQLHGGGGNDTVGSRGGADQLSGGRGDDHIVGGAGDDTLEGGSGSDVLQGGASDAGTWRFTLDEGELVSRFEAAAPDMADADGFAHRGPWGTTGDSGRDGDSRLAFSHEPVERQQLVATLYKAATGERPPLAEYNDLAGGGQSALALAETAAEHILSEQDAVAGALQVQVPMLIEAVWGKGAATDALVEEGVDLLNGGASRGEAMLSLAGAPEAEQLLREDIRDDELVLTRPYETGETGWSSQTGEDILRGGAGNDRLVGGDGPDWLDGGAGTDVAVFTGSPDDFTFRVGTDEQGRERVELTHTASGETDTLQGMEVFGIGGRYYEPVPDLSAIEPETDYAMSDFVVQLTGQTVEAMDLAG